jgi:hypothetical protein
MLTRSAISWNRIVFEVQLRSAQYPTSNSILLRLPQGSALSLLEPRSSDVAVLYTVTTGIF